MSVEVTQIIPVLWSKAKHTRMWCNGGASWDVDDGKELGMKLYLVVGYPVLDSGGRESAGGWWCENCCRERGWLW